MNTKVIKKMVEDYAESQHLSVAQFCRSKLDLTDTSYYRMLKDRSFKLQLIINIADIIGVSIDELIGRNSQAENISQIKKLTAENDSINKNYLSVVEQQNEKIRLLEATINDKEDTIKDKLKIISLLETQIYASVKRNS